MPAIRKQSAGIKKRNQSAILAKFENYNLGMTPKEAFVDQIDRITRGTRLTPYDAIYDWVRGGGVLVYNQDIKKYMAEKRRREERELSARIASRSKSKSHRKSASQRTDSAGGRHYKPSDSEGAEKNE